MGVLNVTPDSFSDGGRFADPAQAVRAGIDMLRDGADMLDVGGESTRPGAGGVSAHEQLGRVLPVITGLRQSGVTAPISIDTTRAEVADAALNAGADVVNDVSAGLDDPDMLNLVAKRQAGLVLMHRLQPPAIDSYSTSYARSPEYDLQRGGVVGCVAEILAQRLSEAERAGVDRQAIALDPGLGFGKSVAQNFELIARIGEVAPDGVIILAGASRKSFIGAATDEPEPGRRIAGSAAAAVALCLGGAHVVRAHDVREHVAALAVAGRVRAGRPARDGFAASGL